MNETVGCLLLFFFLSFSSHGRKINKQTMMNFYGFIKKNCIVDFSKKVQKKKKQNLCLKWGGNYKQAVPSMRLRNWTRAGNSMICDCYWI